MTKIIYRSHLKRRLKERKIPKSYPKLIYKDARLTYLDGATKHSIAVSKLKYAGKLRYMAIVYDTIDENVEVITIYPTTAKELKNKINSGRWIKKENIK